MEDAVDSARAVRRVQPPHDGEAQDGAALNTALRWGLLGTAEINRRLIPALRAARRSTLAAVASRDGARAASYAEEWEIPVAHASYEALVRESGVDAVYVPLPNALHVEWTLRALDAGKHVLCEKPLALNAEDVDRIAAVAAAHGLHVSEAFMYRHEPITARLLELVREGAIGPVRTLWSGFTFAQRRANDVRLIAELGGGSLWDVGCYAVSIARLTVGAEPVEVLGWGSPPPPAVDESFTGMLRFPDGAVAAIHSSFRSAYRTWLEIGGRDGTIRVAAPFKPGPREHIELASGRETRQIAVDGSPLLFVREIEDFVASALDGRPPVIPLADSRGNAAALDALYASARTGRPVLL